MQSPEILFENGHIRFCVGYNDEGHKYHAIFYMTSDPFGTTCWRESDMVSGSMLTLINKLIEELPVKK